MTAEIERLAQIVDDAAREHREIPKLTSAAPLALDDAYAIQRASVARRLARGETRIGVKMGFTSRAKMIQMGCHDVVWGRLTSAMLVADHGTIDLRDYVHPRVEPEIAFLLREELAGDVTPARALAAVEAIAPALEIIDSRYQKFQFTVPDVVADNTSSASLVVGAWCDPHQRFDNLGMLLEFDGRPVQIGSSAAILGHPLRALAAAARLSAEPLRAGWIVMAGGATAAEALRPGVYVRNVVQNLGSVGFHVAKES
ncbi:MAG TPA: fumarylacetoacetate hydrolase family protein [Kofleriaceae bacterium]